jgi:hypothetical protein
MSSKDETKKRRRVKKFRLDEISLVDRPAHAPARIAIMKREADTPVVESIQKKLAMTSLAAGHAHAVVMVRAAPDGLAELRAGQTSFVDGHAHDWVMDDAGNIIFADSEGHSHGLSILITKEQLDELAELEKREFSVEQRKELAEKGHALPDGSFPIVNSGDLKNAIQAFGRAKNKAKVARHIKRRARALGLTDTLPEDGPLADLLRKDDDLASNQQTAGETGDSNGDDIMSKKEETPAGNEPQAVTQEQLDELTKRNERLEQIVKLSPEQREHFNKLEGSEQDEFLSNEDKDAVLKNLADEDPIVYTAADGTEIRKSAGEHVLRLTKDNDELRKNAAKAEALAKRADFEKRAKEELEHLTGDDGAKADLLEAVETIPVEKREAVMAILKSKDAGMAKAFETIGTSDSGNGDNDAEAKLTALAKAHGEKHPELTPEQAYSAVLDTPEGRELHAQHLNG